MVEVNMEGEDRIMGSITDDVYAMVEDHPKMAVTVFEMFNASRIRLAEDRHSSAYPPRVSGVPRQCRLRGRGI